MPRTVWALFSLLSAVSLLVLSFPVDGAVTYSPVRPTHEDAILLTYAPALEDNTTTVTLMLSINNSSATNIDMTKLKNNATGEYNYDLGTWSAGTILSYSVLAWNRTVDDGNISVASAVDVLWHNSLEPARALAKRLGRPMLILFWSQGEKASTDMMIGPFNDESVLNLSTRFVCVKMEVSSNPDLYHQWGLDKTPTIVFLDNNSKEVDRASGPLSKDKLVAHMQFSIGLGPKPKEKIRGIFADPIRNILVVAFLLLLVIAIVAVRARSLMKRP
jgi:hypothetical protein